MSANMAEPSVESYGRSKYKLLREAQGAKKNASKNDASEQIKRIPWHLKSDWKNCIYLLQRILFHVTPRIAAVKNATTAQTKKIARSTRRLSRTGSKIAIEMFGTICLKINEICSEIEIGNEEWEACRRFHEYDLDKSGYIDGNELSLALHAMGIASTSNEYRAITTLLDKDGDKKISETEFIKAISSKCKAL